MTTIATQAPAAARSRLNGIVVATVLACAGAIAGALTIWYVAMSPTLYRPTGSGIVRGIYVAAFVAAGSYTLWRRPASRLGPLLAGIGFVYGLSSLNASGDEVPFTLGMVAWACWVALLLYTTLCFPHTHPGSRLERAFARTLWIATGVLWLLILLVAEKLPKGGEFADCGSNCPANALQIVDAPNAVNRVLDAAYGLTIGITLAGVAALLVVKARSPTRLRRRAVEPLSYAVSATIAVFVLNLAVVRVAPGTKPAFWAIEAVVALSAPVAIVLGQIRARMFATERAGGLVAATSGRAVTPELMQTLIRETLGDPGLVLARFVPETGSYVDAAGAELELPGESEERTVTPVVRDGRVVGALVHDPVLDSDAAVVEGVGATSLMLLENVELVDELRASRGRIVTAAEHERLRLERDLHDGAQQRLMAIQIKLALLRDRIDAPAIAAEIDEIGDDAAAAVEELRALAHGIYPTVLRERGLGDGLRSLARGAALPVEVVDDGIGRCAPEVEAAVYFCAAEAMQNARKHAGPGARVTVTLGRHGDEASFAVVDDGAGFVPAAAVHGLGLVSMRDRIGAVGGELELVSAPGRGTTVRGHVPARPAASDG